MIMVNDRYDDDDIARKRKRSICERSNLYKKSKNKKTKDRENFAKI